MTDRSPSIDPAAPPPGLTWRDPVLWLVIGPPLAAVLGGLATVWIAASYRDPLVTDTVRKVGVSWQDAAPAPAGAAGAAKSIAPAGAPATNAPADAPTTAPDDDGG